MRAKPRDVSTPRAPIREIRAASDPAFAAAHALLQRSFPRSELLPLREWRNAMRERQLGLWTDIRWHLLVAERDGDVIAAASGSYLGNVNVGVIGYVAVGGGEQARGLGPLMRRALLRRFERDANEIAGEPLTAVVGEVRADNPWLKSLVKRSDEHEPVPLVLYYQPYGPERTVDADLVRRLLYTMWRRMYRIALPLRRREFRRMLRSLAGRRRIGQRRLE
jgi:hypothetical protein